MEFLPEPIAAYAEEFTTPENTILAELNRETYSKILIPRMLSGHLQGQMLAMFSHMIQPTNILEIGTYTGYSAICLAKGLTENGVLHTVDINDELNPMVLKYIQKAGLEDKIVTHCGDAKKIIPTLPKLEWDIVFLDADKERYLYYYQEILPSVRKGGFILVDNVLWSGKVCLSDSEIPMKDAETRRIKEFNAYITNDDRVENVLLPVRDGCMVIRKL